MPSGLPSLFSSSLLACSDSALPVSLSSVVVALSRKRPTIRSAMTARTIHRPMTTSGLLEEVLARASGESNLSTRTMPLR